MWFVTILGWLACCIYATIPSFWLVIHPRTEKWRERKRQRKAVYNILVPMWMGMWVALFAITYPWRGIVLYTRSWSWIGGAVLIANGFFL